MTATIHRIPLPTMTQTTLTRHLTGHHAQGPAPGGPMARMQSISAARAYVRHLSRRFSFSDTCGRDDVWRQVEDMIALVPTVAVDVVELDMLAHALREALNRARMSGLATSRIAMRSCGFEVSAFGRTARMRMHDHDRTRIITVRLSRDGALRIDDGTVRS
jgi:hypothetical protein